MILPLSIFWAVAACDPTIEYVALVPDVPAQLLEPTPISDRQAVTYRDLALLATEHLNSAQQANADKAAIKQILTCAKKEAKPC